MGTCAPLRFGTTNHVPVSTLSASPAPLMPLDYVKDEYPSRVARWTTTTAAGEIVVTSTLASDQTIEYVAIPGSNLLGAAEIRVEILDAAGAAVAGHTASFVTLGELIPLGIWRVGVDPYNVASDDFAPSVYVLWLARAFRYRACRVTIRPHLAAGGDVRLRMLLMGEGMALQRNFSVGGELTFLSPPEYVQTASGSYLPARLQRTARRMTLSLDLMTRHDRTRLQRMEAALRGRPFIVSAYPDRTGWERNDHTFLARFADALAYRTRLDGIYQSTLTMVEV